MSKNQPAVPFIVRALIVFSVLAFVLFMIRLVLFWTGLLPTFGQEITNAIVVQWVATFVLDSFGLFYGRFLQQKYETNSDVPLYGKAIAWILILLIAYQLFSVVLRSFAGLSYNAITKQEKRVETQGGPFQPY